MCMHPLIPIVDEHVCYRARWMQPHADDTTSDAEPVRRVAASEIDHHAESEVCRRFAPRIRLYGLKHLRDEERARDLVQLVLVAVIQAMRAGRVSEPELLARFVLGTCRHIAMRVRARDARSEPMDGASLELLGVEPAATTTLEALDVEALNRCMGALDARARSVLHLSFYRDKSAEEIGEALAMTPGNVRVVRHRAMAQLRSCMEASP